jgi:hypothetical protein
MGRSPNENQTCIKKNVRLNSLHYLFGLNTAWFILMSILFYKFLYFATKR